MEGEFEAVQRLEMVGLEAPDPAHGDVMDRDGIEEMEFFAPAPHAHHEVGSLEDGEVLRDRLPAHVVAVAELAEGQTSFIMQAVEEHPSAGIGEGLEDVIAVGHAGNMQLNGCMSIGRPAPVANHLPAPAPVWLGAEADGKAQWGTIWNGMAGQDRQGGISMHRDWHTRQVDWRPLRVIAPDRR